VRAPTNLVFDPDLLARARGGDRDALSAILDHYYERIHRMLVHLVGRSPDVDDLRQQVLLAVVRGIGGFRGDSELGTWIGGICVNVARERIRGKRASRERFADDGEPAIDATAGPDVVARIESRAELVAVERALATLSTDQRAAFVLATVYGHSVEEIATIMKAARSTTRLRLYYGRKKFRAALARLQGDAADLDDGAEPAKEGST
jgi:RNA polymerase sigma-70 factor (ECF subfamily)